MGKKEKILVCGILPPPFFGHSVMYKILMESSFVGTFDIIFLDMKFWTYAQHNKVTLGKLFKLVKYLGQYIWIIVTKHPGYVLYNMSFDRMPFLKDFLFCFLGKLLGCRVVIHDMGQYVKELYRSSGRVYQALIRWLLKNTTACILLGEGTKSVYKGLIAKERLISVPGSVEDSEEISVENYKRRDSSEDIIILYFSYMAKSKGILTAFKAVPEVLNSCRAARFIFAGPMESASIQAAFNHLREKFGSRIEHLGYIGDIKERTRIYRGADIFIFPTRRDVFGLVLLHAMAERLPIVASIEGTVPEIIKDGENGFLIHKGDDKQLARRILQLANDRSLRKAMGEANRKRYLNVYSPQRYGRRMTEAFGAIRQLP